MLSDRVDAAETPSSGVAGVAQGEHVRFQSKVRRLRLVIIAAFCWFLLFEPLRYLIFGIAQYNNDLLDRVVDALSLLVLGTVIIYLMVQIRTLTKVVRPVLLGFGLFVIAQGLNLGMSFHLLDALLVGPWEDVLRGSVKALSDMGVLLAMAGLLYAIAELYRTS